MPAGRFWTEAELQLLRQHFPHTPTAALAQQLGRTYRSLAEMAHRLGIGKSQAYLAQAGRFSRPPAGSVQHRFEPGQEPWNKGVKGSCGHHPNSAAHHFSSGKLNGRAAQLVAPVGTLRLNGDGVLERKISEIPGSPHLRWKPVHRLVWEAAHGPVPAGHFVVFKPGHATTDLARITPEVLEVVTRAENMRRNSIHTRVPAELMPVVRARSALTRAINTRARQAQQPQEPTA